MLKQSTQLFTELQTIFTTQDAHHIYFIFNKLFISRAGKGCTLKVPFPKCIG